MSLLQGIVTQVVQNALAGNQPQQQAQQGGLGGLLGGLTGGNAGGNSALGGMLGSVVAGQVAKNNPALGGLLGSVLGGQQRNTSAGDLGTWAVCLAVKSKLLSKAVVVSTRGRYCLPCFLSCLVLSKVTAVCQRCLPK